MTNEVERGATLSEYGLIVSLIVVSTIGMIARLQDESGSYLVETGSDIGTPRELSAEIDSDLPEPPAWLTQPPPPTTTTTTGTSPGTLVALHSGKCLEGEGASTANEVPMVQADCSGAAHQSFTLRSVGGNDVQIVTSSGKCLRPLADSTASGTDVVQNTCDGSTFALWTYASKPEGLELRGNGTDRCLDVFGASAANGARTIQWDCHGGSNQTFAFSGVIG